PLGELPDDSPVLDPLRQAGTGEPLPPLTIDVGIAAYKGDRMVGFLDGKDARGFLWAVGRVHHTDLEIPDPSGQPGLLGLTVIRASSSIKPILNGRLPSIKVQVHVDLELSEVPFAVRTGKEVVDALEHQVNALVEREIRSTLGIVQGKLKSDIYGFGRLVWQANPRLWSQLEPVWNDEVFPLVKVEIEVKSRIRGPGSILRE
ncbi:MAG: Ger(x)C family spore germination C-terminal domain-containing protein, partial [Bacillota bacterium]|nr:Ger(x)C family spore germination C-terminal domain-containing protein [Bacillota bacterium]